MPQMSPMYWEILFMVFIFSFLMMNTIIFFNMKMYPSQSLSKIFKVNQFKWKW
uniref:ATP synthase complex subunit 8 n=1 Tax=Enoplops potanini TaxID=2716288 RepID=A0A6G7MZ77_9HEMI|nr:ATP synthase F0 subunit 8 [Enoplops potanini]QIJ46457.1 ATP synthase F0 subunit 8 [Enoplops potanini]